MKTFAEIVSITEARQSGASTVAKCRAHEDNSPSLSISQGDDGRILFKCFAGCSVESILLAYGLDWQDVLPERERHHEDTKTWAIRDTAGKLIAEHIRIEEPGKKKRYVWKRDGHSGLAGMPASSLPLYRAEKFFEFDPVKAVVLCEGEKATDAAARLGTQALGTVSGASSAPGTDALAILAGRHVVLWPDFDGPGLEHMGRIAEVLAGVAASVRWIHQPGARAKDDAANYGGTLAELKAVTHSEAPSLSSPLVMLADCVDDAVRELDKLHAGDYSDFVGTGLETLDRKLGGGFRRGTVTLIGAPSGAGKTTLVVQFAMSAEAKGLAILVSPEMSARELVVREIVRRSGKPKWHRSPWARWSQNEAKELHDAAARDITVSKPRVAMFDSLNVKLADVVLAARDAHKKMPLAFIALDYAQQLADETSDKARYLLVGEVGHRAIEMAREFECPVIVTSQVNTFKDGREKNYSFRESQLLEHKAHLVMLFIVERNESGNVERAYFRTTKARDAAMFELDVFFEPSTFTVSDLESRKAGVRDWTNEPVEDRWGLT